MKSDGHFQLPVKKTEPIVYHAEELSPAEKLMSNIRDAKGLKAQLAAAGELYKGIGDVENKDVVVNEVVEIMNSAIKNHLRLKPSLALEAVLLRDAIRTGSGVQSQEEELVANDIFKKTDSLAGVIEGLSAVKQKLALEAFREAHPDTWVDTYLKLTNETGFRLVGEMVQILIDTGHFNKFKGHLTKLIIKRKASTDLMLWIGKNRSDSLSLIHI